MPNFKTHRNVGVVVAVLFGVWAFSSWGVGYWLQILASMPLIVFASLLPDIDHPLSFIRRFVEVCLLLFACYVLYTIHIIYGIAIILSVVLLWFVTHRGIFHHPIMSLMGYGAFQYYGYSVVISQAFAVGYTTHIILDYMFGDRK